MRYVKYNISTGVKRLWSKTTKLSFSSVTLGLATLGVGVAVPIIATATPPPVDTTIVVGPSSTAKNAGDVVSNPKSWFFYNDESDVIDDSLGSFVNGPATPPAGSGSAQISVSGSQRRNLATYQFSGTALADITELKYSTYNPSAGNGGSASRSGYLNFNVDFDGSDTWQRRLVFLPADNGTVHQDTWDTWDAVNGGSAMYRYSGTTWPGTATSGTTPRTLSDLISSYPGIRIRVTDSWLGIRVGEPYADGYTENIDKFVFGTAAGTTTYDFEATLHPSKNYECRNNGWMMFNAPSYSSESECKHWVNGHVGGHFWASGPSQEIEVRARNIPERASVMGAKSEKVHYINYDYPGVLDYTADVLCTNVFPDTNEARFMYQIPEGHPGLTGLYVVMVVTEGRHGTPTYGLSSTADEATATKWCQTGEGFSPTYYDVTRGWVNINN